MSKIILFEDEMECCGCSACECICPQNAISMVENKEGFLYPIINESLCIECGLCQRVCPIGNFHKSNLIKREDDKVQIGILSLSDTENFGAKIVTYALQKKIEELIPNTQVSVIQFKADTCQDDMFTVIKERVRKQGVIKPLMHYVDYQKLSKTHKKEFGDRKIKFNEFDNQYLNIRINTKKISDFKFFANSLDAIVVGSDIVFRPEFAQLYPMVYFLECVTNNKLRKISYAASIGTDDMEVLEPLTETYSDGLKNFDYISTREKKSQYFLQQLTDKKVELCCDPVMLLGINDFEFENNFKKPQKDYIFMYVLDKNDRAIKYAKKLAKEKNMDVYYYAEKNLDSGIMHNVFSEGPAEFIQRIKNASYVITNSFHCIVFSIMFKKPFVAFMRTRQSLKISNILEMYGLQNRAVTGKIKFDIDETIDWESVHNIWLEIQSSSSNYLEKALLDI